MALPLLARPVTRPHFVDPATCIDTVHGTPDDLRQLWLDLLFGANFNDPASFRSAGYGQVMNSAFRAGRF
jgi:cyanobactin biosynthesis protein (PatB/AcyB/McaB family)